MTPEIALVIGLVLAALVIPSAFSDLAARRPPRTTALVALAAGLLTWYALRTVPGGLTLSEIPDAFFAGIGQILH